MTIMYRHFVFIGLGGGWRTVLDIAFFASFFMPKALLRLIDGGSYDARQLDHEHFLFPGNKARVQADFIRREFPEVGVEHVPRYIGAETSDSVAPVDKMIPDGSVAFLLVDNNRTRRIVCDHAATLDNVTILCGGTNQDQLRVNVHIRRDGVDLTTPLPDYLDAIARPSDKTPYELERENCTDRLGERERFHPFTMMATSTFLGNAFYEVWRRETQGTLDKFPYNELWYDIRTGRNRTEQYTRQSRR